MTRSIRGKLHGKRIAVLATDGFEAEELLRPLQVLRDLGAEVDVVSPKIGEIRGWDRAGWGASVRVDVALEDAPKRAYDAVVIPGGPINPDSLRGEPRAVSLVRHLDAEGKPVAAICQGGSMLIEAGIVRGRATTSNRSIRTDMENAGARWREATVVIDGNLVTSGQCDDLAAFTEAVAERVSRPPDQRWWLGGG